MRPAVARIGVGALALLLFAMALARLVEAQQIPGVPDAEAAAWWVSPKGTALGPYDLRQLVEMAEAGEIDARTYVWREGMAAWTRLGEVKALSPVMAAVAKLEAEREALGLAAWLVGSWQAEGALMRDEELVSIELLLSFRADGSMFWLDTSYLPGGDISKTNWKGSFLVTYVGPGEFDLLMKLETADVLWEARRLGPDSFYASSVDLRLERK